jgi:hypothetical protein
MRSTSGSRYAAAGASGRAAPRPRRCRGGSGEWTIDFASPDPVPAPVTTIAWRLAHIIVSCLGYRVAWYFGGPEVDFRTFAYAGTADEALQQLDETYKKWNAGVRGLSDIDLDRPVGPTEGPGRFPMEGLVLHINRELIHHGAEIRLARSADRNRFTTSPRAGPMRTSCEIRRTKASNYD